MPTIAPLVGLADPFFASRMASGRLELVPSTNQSPWKEVCRLIVDHPGGRELATGWVLGFGTIVTAAHVFRGSRTATIHVWPGAHGGVALFGTHKTTLFDTAKDGSDCAAVFLDEPLDGRLGAVDVNRFSAVAPQSILAVAGYDGSDGGQHQFRARGGQLTPQDARIRYAVATTNGQSGGPVWADDVPVVVAVHNDLQLAVPITESLIAEMLVWRQHVPRVSVAVSMSAGTRRVASIGVAEAAIPASTFRPMSAVAAAATEIGANACEAVGRSIGEFAGPRISENGPLTLIVDDDQAFGGLSFRAQCVLAGVADSLPGRVRCPQIARSLQAIPPVGATTTTGSASGASNPAGGVDSGADTAVDITADNNVEQPAPVLQVRLADMASGELAWCATLLDHDDRVRAARTGTYGDSRRLATEASTPRSEEWVDAETTNTTAPTSPVASIPAVCMPKKPQGKPSSRSTGSRKRRGKPD
jgi:hypothetical protein